MLTDSTTVPILLFGVAMVAGFIDTLAGGGGLITIPALLLAQVPPVQALATNKLQGSFGTLTAAGMMLRKRLVRFTDVRAPFVCALLGGSAGAATVQLIDPGALDVVVPVVLIGIALYFLLAPKAGDADRAPRISESLYRRVVIPLIGFYDGVFGPGTGSFFSLAGVSLRGQNLVTATAFAKVLNFATNVASLAVFIAGGKVLWLTGAAMVAGQVIGAYAGSQVVVKGGTRIIRPLIVGVCVVMVGRYFWQKGLLQI